MFGVIGGGFLTVWIPGYAYAVIPLVAVGWGVVYALVPGREGRWPWWVLGQWLTLALVHGVSFTVAEGFAGYVLGLTPATAALATLAWMIPVGLVQLHRTHWNTKRPGVTRDTPDIPDVAGCPEPSTTP